MYNKTYANYIILLSALFTLSACDTLFGTKGQPAYPSRTASVESRRDEELFTTAYEVQFDSNGTKPDVESMATIKNVADMIMKSDPATVVVTGYTDAYGPASYNRKLSAKRAETVAKILVKEGVDSRLIRTEGKGEDDLLFPTQDNIKLLENRRVVIQLKK